MNCTGKILMAAVTVAVGKRGFDSFYGEEKPPFCEPLNGKQRGLQVQPSIFVGFATNDSANLHILPESGSMSRTNGKIGHLFQMFGASAVVSCRSILTTVIV